MTRLGLGWIFGIIGGGLLFTVMIVIFLKFAGWVSEVVMWVLLVIFLMIAVVTGLVFWIGVERKKLLREDLKNITPEEGKAVIKNYFGHTLFSPGRVGFNFSKHFEQVIDLEKFGHRGRILFTNVVNRKGYFNELIYVALRLDDASLISFIKDGDVDKIKEMVNRISPVDISDDVESVVRELPYGRELIERKRPKERPKEEESLADDESVDKEDEK